MQLHYITLTGSLVELQEFLDKDYLKCDDDKRGFNERILIFNLYVEKALQNISKEP